MSTTVKVVKGMRVRVDLSEPEGKLYKGRVFIVESEPRKIGGTLAVALNNLDGTRFSPAYDLSMLHVLPLK